MERASFDDLLWLCVYLSPWVVDTQKIETIPGEGE